MEKQDEIQVKQFEHAFLPDYGLERGEYIDAFMKNVDWEIISERYDKVVLANSFATTNILRGQ